MTAPTLTALAQNAATSPAHSPGFEAWLSAIQFVASSEGTFDAARVRARVAQVSPEYVHFNAGCVYTWLLGTGRARVTSGRSRLNNVEHRAVNRWAPVYALVGGA